MGYIKSWTDYETVSRFIRAQALFKANVQAATQLYAKSPNQVRYCVKFKPKTGQLVLRLTDDTTCIMYKTFSAIILNRFEMLNTRLLSQVANVKPKPREVLAVPTTEARAGTPAGEGAAGGDDPMNGTGAATTAEGKKDEKKAGGGKKKKKGKK